PRLCSRPCHLNDLKKENFSLKLRIYFLEEKIQQKFEESGDDVHKRNIELKVEVESLKKELEEKSSFWTKLCESTAESLSNQNEAELQRRLAERQEEIVHMQEILQTKVQLLQEVHTHTHTQIHLYSQDTCCKTTNNWDAVQWMIHQKNQPSATFPLSILSPSCGPLQMQHTFLVVFCLMLVCEH
uniref:Centrosomin N-terminal motif 1 domain-containing protein n=1 Tax=Sander lucioperca TaxID=283035 RepID=A0A8C9ZM99_SANLU